jgi:hypothetical protein
MPASTPFLPAPGSPFAHSLWFLRASGSIGRIWVEGVAMRILPLEVRLGSWYTVSHGDDRLRRERLAPNCKPRGAELVKSAHKTSAKRTDFAALPLAA